MMLKIKNLYLHELYNIFIHMQNIYMKRKLTLKYLKFIFQQNYLA